MGRILGAFAVRFMRLHPFADGNERTCILILIYLTFMATGDWHAIFERKWNGEKLGCYMDYQLWCGNIMRNDGPRMGNILFCSIMDSIEDRSIDGDVWIDSGL